MTLLEQARSFRAAFGQETPGFISRYGFVKKVLWDLQVELINEESCEFLEAAEECFADPENLHAEKTFSKNSAILSTSAISLLLLLALIWIRLWIVFTSQT